VGPVIADLLAHPHALGAYNFAGPSHITHRALHPAHARSTLTNATPAPDLLFVYGTLMRGERLAHIIEAQAPLAFERAHCRGALLDLGDYPGLVHNVAGDKHSVVHGELISLRDGAAALLVLDEVEGFVAAGHRDNLYQRCRVVVTTGDGRSVHAWTYVHVADRQGATTIAGGDWRASRRRP